MGIMPPIYDEIRDAIRRSEKTRYRMALETGISQPQLSNFMKGDKGLSVESLEKLADCMGLEITTRPKPSRPQRKARTTAGANRKDL